MYFCGPYACRSEKLQKRLVTRAKKIFERRRARAREDGDDDDGDDDDEKGKRGSGKRKLAARGGKSTKITDKNKKQKKTGTAKASVDRSITKAVKGKAAVANGKAAVTKCKRKMASRTAKTKGKSKGKGKGKAKVFDDDSDFIDDDDDDDDDYTPFGTAGGADVASDGSDGPADSDDDAPDSESEYSDEYSDDDDDDDDDDDMTPEEIEAAINSDVEEAKRLAKRESTASRASSSRDVTSSILHGVQWRRIILDEAHAIKDRSCNTAQACFTLSATFRWALSGTPLQNRVGELYSIIRFLRLDPYSYYFCSHPVVDATTGKPIRGQKCDCKSLWDMDEDGNCVECGHHKSRHWCWWNRKIANPIKYNGYEGKGRDAMFLLRNEVLAKSLLRRTKESRSDDLALPPRSVTVRRDRLDTKELDFYSALYTQSRSHFSTFVQAGTVLHNYAHIFDLLIKLRQAVNHPYLVLYKKTGATEDGTQQRPSQLLVGNGAKDDDEEEDVVECALCHDPPVDSVVATCGHVFCKACVLDLMEEAEDGVNSGTNVSRCPACSSPLTVDLTKAARSTEPSALSLQVAPSGVAVARRGKTRVGHTDTAGSKPRSRQYPKGHIMRRIGGDVRFHSSTKIEALREELHILKREDPSAKAIVFSQFITMLELVEYRLQSCGVGCVRLTGSMSLADRDLAIANFTNDPEIDVFLISLKAGGVALNLTAASCVFLLDPWWNPAVEQQAQDRIHRLGQHKPIKTIHLIAAGTIEERIMKLQEKKKLIFEGTVGQSTEALGRLTEDDLR